MKSASAGFLTRIALAQASLCRLARITRRNGVIHRLSSTGANVVLGDETFLGNPGFDASSITFRRDGTSAAGEIRIAMGAGDTITAQAIAAGRFDGAKVDILVCDFLSPGSGSIVESSGFLGNLTYTDGGDATFEIIGLLARLSETALETFGPNCNVSLGSPRCRVPLLPALVQRSTAYAASDSPRGAMVRVFQGGSYNNRIYECTTSGTTAASAPTYTTTVGDTTTDGSAVFTCRESWTREAVVATVTNRSKFSITVTEPRGIDGWFDNGALRFDTGENAGLAFDVRRWTDAGNIVELWHKAAHDIAVGDTLMIHPGCDKTYAGTNGCAKFANQRLFQGFSKIPGDEFEFKASSEATTTPESTDTSTSWTGYKFYGVADSSGSTSEGYYVTIPGMGEYLGWDGRGL